MIDFSLKPVPLTTNRRCSEHFVLDVITHPQGQELHLRGSFHLVTPVSAPASVGWSGGQLELSTDRPVWYLRACKAMPNQRGRVALVSHLP